MLKLTRSAIHAEDAFKREEEEGGWLEIYGETGPTANSGTGTPAQKGASIYEYRWAIGLLVSFDSVEAEGVATTDQSKGLLSNAVFHYMQSGDNISDIWIPAENDFLSLSLAPASS
jgi:hypothetical protein